MLMPFANGEFALEMIPDGDSFKVAAAGLARALGFRDAFNLTASIPEAEKGYLLASTPGGDQRVLFVTESGFYRAIGQRHAARISDELMRAAVERFQSWVYGEVLPQLRRGSLPQRELTRKQLALLIIEAEEALEVERDRAVRAEFQAIEMAPAARAWDELMEAHGDYDGAQAAQILNRDPSISTGRGRLFAYLDSIRWTYKHPGQARRAYQTQVDLGRLLVAPTHYDHPNTGERTLGAPQIRVTVKGLLELHKRLGGSADFEVLMSEEVPA